MGEEREVELRVGGGVYEREREREPGGEWRGVLVIRDNGRMTVVGDK